MTKPSKTAARGERSADTVLRAVAIAAVVLIHVLSSIQPSPFYETAGVWQWVVVGLDQAARVSVPLFVALSGYGLWQGYGERLSLAAVPGFWYRRVTKLLPTYVAWSIVFAVVFMIFPTWTTRETLPSFPWQLVWGRADYHLYFVPMILQLYLLFPVLTWVQRRWPKVLLLSALLLQLSWYAYYSYGKHVPLDLVFFAGDSEQYLWSPNWVWYFVLGMQLPSVLQYLRQRYVFSVLIAMSTLVWMGLVVGAVSAINTGIDPLLALKFTRFEVMLYATLAVTTMLVGAQSIKKVPRVVELLGVWSYHIYLSHTLVLRVIFNILLR